MKPLEMRIIHFQRKGALCEVVDWWGVYGLARTSTAEGSEGRQGEGRAVSRRGQCSRLHVALQDICTILRGRRSACWSLSHAVTGQLCGLVSGREER